MLERMVLEPTIVEYARAQGLQRTPEFIAEMEKKREGVLVNQLYQDSVQARITVTAEERKRYFAEHQGEFSSRERVRYAVIPRVTEAGADSVIARLKAGESPQAILAADSASGMRGGVIKDLLEGQPHGFRTVLFEELRPGGSTKFYLTGNKLWTVLHVLSHEPSRPMAYDEVVDVVGSCVENLAAERLLDDLLDRLRPRHKLELHPEMLMQVKLTDPAGDIDLPSGD